MRKYSWERNEDSTPSAPYALAAAKSAISRLSLGARLNSAEEASPLRPQPSGRDTSWNRRDYNSITAAGGAPVVGYSRPTGDSFLRRNGSFAFRKTRQQTQTELQTLSSATTWFLLFFPASIALLFLLIPAGWSQEQITFNPRTAATSTYFPHPSDLSGSIPANSKQQAAPPPPLTRRA